MQPIWTLIVVLLAFFVILHLRGRKRRIPETKVYARRIDGFQIAGYLHPHVNAACLADHGVQYGKGFRRKEGPKLPHDAQCRCRSVPFSFTSTEVFHGALRRGVPPASSIPGLPPDDALALLEALRAWNGSPPPDNVAAFLSEVGLDRFSEGYRPQIETFLRERHAFLMARSAQQALPLG
jgi:hypothetical protein